jgi:hypothetical protein
MIYRTPSIALGTGMGSVLTLWTTLGTSNWIFSLIFPEDIRRAGTRVGTLLARGAKAEHSSAMISAARAATAAYLDIWDE